MGTVTKVVEGSLEEDEEGVEEEEEAEEREGVVEVRGEVNRPNHKNNRIPILTQVQRLWGKESR